MQKFLRTLTLLAFLMVPWVMQAQTLAEYQLSVGSTTYTSIADPSLLLSSVNGDGGTQTVALPFDFAFGETTFTAGTNVTVRADGYLYFGTSSPGHQSRNAWTGSTYKVISPYFNGDGKITASGATSGAYSTVQTDANGQMLVIEFKGLTCYYSPYGEYNFQVRLHANGNISTVYGSSTFSTATTGGVSHNFFLKDGSDGICLTGSFANPVAGTPATLPSLATPAAVGTVITYVRPIITCPKVASVDTANSTANSATINWTAGGTETKWKVFVNGTYRATVENTPTYNLTGLNANSDYTVGVLAVCSDDDEALAAKTKTFRTPCGVIGLPYEDGMEAVPTGSYQMPYCWSRYNNATGSSNYFPYSYTSSAHSGSRALYFYGNTGAAYADTMIAIMPQMNPTTNPLNTLRFSFWAKKSANNAITVKVGTMSDPENASTFVADTTLELTTTYANYAVKFKHSPATNAYVAIMVLKPTTTTSVYVDDVRLEAPTCWPAEHFAARNIAAKTMHLSWDNEMSPNATYELSYMLLNKKRTQIINDTAFDVTNLKPETSYTFSLRAICGEGDTASAVTCSATTQPLCMPVTNLKVVAATTNSIRLSWTASETEGAKYRIYCYQLSSDPIADMINPTSRNITGLEPNSTYAFYVYAVNPAGNVSTEYGYVTYTTMCETMAPEAASDDFESYYAGSAYFPTCWNKIGSASMYVTSSYTHSGSRDLYIYGYTEGIVVMPAVEIPASGIKLNFWARTNTYTTTPFAVGYVTDIFDANSFVRVDTITFSANNTYQEKTVRFEGTKALPAGARIAFRKVATGTSAKTIYVDDVTLEEILACDKPENLQVTPTMDGGNLTWTASTGATKYIVYVDGDSVAEPTTASYTLTGLQGSSTYTVSVAAFCTNGLTGTISATLNTLCPLAELPYSEDFDSYPNYTSDYSATGADVPTCWVLSPAIGQVTRAPHVGTMGATSGRGLVMTAGTSSCKQNNIAVLPAMANPLNQLQISFDFNKEESAATTKLFVGYVTDASDTTTFVPLTQAPAAYSGHIDYAFAGNTIPAGARIAIKVWRSSSYYYATIDNVVVSVVPSCNAPTNLAVSNVTTNGALLNWDAVTGVSQYIVKVNGEEVTPRPTTNSCLLTGLTPATGYAISLQAVCPQGDETTPVTLGFYTACGVQAIPFAYDFENVDAFSCWTMTDCDANTGIYSNAGYEGDNAFAFYYNTNPPQYLISPELQTGTSQLAVDFMYRNQSASYPETFMVGYSTTTSAVSAFTWGDEITASNTEWTRYFGMVPAGTKFVAIKYTSNDMYYLYIDNFSVSEPPTCYAPLISEIDGDAGRSAVVTLVPANESLGNEMEYIYYVAKNEHLYSGQTPNWEDADTTDAPVFTVTGLEPVTDYLIWVRANCGATDGMSTVASGSFTTGISCPVPTNPQVSGIHHNVAKFSWEGDAAEYEFFLNTEPYIGTATRTVVSATEYGPELQPLTTYYAWVRAICAAGDTSLTVATFTPFITYCTYDPCYVRLMAIDTIARDGWQECQVDLFQEGKLMGSVTINDNAAKLDTNYNDIFVCAEQAIELVLRKGYFDEENAIAVYDQDGNDLYHHNGLDTIADGGRIASFASPCPDIVPPVEYKTTIGETCITAVDTLYNWVNGNFSKIVNIAEFVNGNDTTVQFTHFVSQYEAQVLMLDIHHTAVERILVEDACDSYRWDLMDIIYTDSVVDTFNYTLVNPSIRSFYGCDSIAELTLNLHKKDVQTIDSAICANNMEYVEDNTLTTGGFYQFVLNGTEDTVYYFVERYFLAPIENTYNASAHFDQRDPVTDELITPYATTEFGCYREKIYNFTFNPIVRNFIDTAACYTFTWDRTGNSWTFDRDLMYNQSTLTNVDTAYSVDTNGCMVMDILHTLVLNDTIGIYGNHNEYPSVYGHYTFHGVDYINNDAENDMILNFIDTTESTATTCATITQLHVTVMPFTTIDHYAASNLDTLVWTAYTTADGPVNVSLTATGNYTKTEYINGQSGNTHVMHYTKLADIAPVCAGSDFSFDIVDGEGTSHTVQATMHPSNGYANIYNADSNVSAHYFYNHDTEKKIITLQIPTNSFFWHYDAEAGWEQVEDTIFKGEPVYTLFNVRYNTLQVLDSTVNVCDNKFPFTWNDSVFVDGNATNVYVRTDVNGCDSTVNVTLNVLATATTDTVAVACDSFKWRGVTYDTTGIYLKKVGVRANGCDTIRSLNLTVNYSTDTNMSVFAESAFNLKTLHTSFPDTTYLNTNGYLGGDLFGPYSTIDSCLIDSVYTRTLKIANGNAKQCDSTINLTLTVHPWIDFDSSIVSSTGAYYFTNFEFSELYTVPTGYTYYDYTVADRPYGYDTLDDGSLQRYGRVDYTIRVGSTNEIVDNRLDKCGLYTWDRNGVTYYSLTEEEKEAHPNATYKYHDFTTGEYVFVDPNNQPYVIDTTSTNLDVINNNGFAVRYRLNLVLAPAKFYNTTKDNYPLSLGHYEMAGFEPVAGYDYNVADTTYSFDFTKDTTGEYCMVIHNVVLNVVNNYDTIDTVVCATQSRFNWGGVNNIVTPTSKSITLVDTLTTLVQFNNNIDSTNVNANTFTYVENAGLETELVHSVRLYQYPTAFKTDNIKVCDSLVWERNGVTYRESTNSAYYFGLDETVGCNINYMLNLTVNDQIYVTDTAVCDSLVWHGMTFYEDTLGFEYAGVELNEMFYPTTGYGEACPLHYVLNLSNVYNSQRVYTYDTNDFVNANGERAMTYTWNVNDESYPVEDQSVIVETGDNYVTYRDSVRRIEVTTDGCPIYDVLMLTLYHADTVADTYMKHFCENDEATFTYGNKTFTKENPTGYAYFYTGADRQDSVVKVQVTYGNIAYENIDTVYSGDEFVWVVNGDTVNTFEATGNYRAEYVSEETFCPVIARMHLTFIPAEHITIRERQLPYTFSTNGVDTTFDLPGVYRIDWAEDDAENIALNGRGYTMLYLDVIPMQPVTVDSLICWYDTMRINAGDLYGNGYYMAEDTTFSFVAGADTTVHLFATNLMGTQDYNVTLNFTVREIHDIVNNVVSCAAYYWDYDEVTYNTDTVVSYPSTDVFGCPNHIVLNYSLGDSTIVEVPVTACGSYTLNGVEYTESTTVIVPGEISAQGCATATVYNITIYNVPNVADTQVVCGTSYVWNNTTYNQSGEYIVAHLDALTNCPVTDTLRLTLNVPVDVNETVASCNDYTWAYNGETYTTSGVYTIDTVDANGCDITATLNLTISGAISETEILTVCDYTIWNGMVLDSSDVYTYTTSSVAGCDSTVTLYLTVNHSVTGPDTTASSCGAFEWNGETLVQSGDYIYEYTAANGCDSIITLHLTVNNPQTGYLTEIACDSFTWTDGNGETYTTSGEYTFNTLTVAGCDSTVTLALTINHSVDVNIETTAMGSYEWHGALYTESGVYTWHGTTVDGCDSIVTLTLTITAQTYTVTVDVNDATMGNVNPSGAITVAAGETFTATATANEGYRFVNWSNGETNATVEIVVNSDITLTANFEAIMYTVTVTSDNETMGTVTGSGEYQAGATVVVEAHANDGYKFVSWSDGTTNAHYEFTVTSDVTLVAHFELLGIDDVEGSNANIYSVDSKIVVSGAENLDVYVYDVNGRCVRTQKNAAETIEFTMNTTGVYLVKVGNAPAKRVIVVR